MNNLRNIFFIIISLFTLHRSVLACEPIIPLGQLALFPGLLAHSFYLLIATVVVKCVSFVFFEKEIVWWKALLFMFLANIFTTILSFISLILTSSGAMILIALPFLGSLAMVPSRELAKKYFPNRNLNIVSSFIGLFLTIMYFASTILFLLAGKIGSNGDFYGYWVAKLLGVYTGLIFGILITIFYEEWCVAKLSGNKDKAAPYLTSVSRANFIALLFMIIITGIIVIPTKLQNQDFGFLIK
jgi:hypothetical protein